MFQSVRGQLPEVAFISEKLKIELGLKMARGEGDE